MAYDLGWKAKIVAIIGIIILYLCIAAIITVTWNTVIVRSGLPPMNFWLCAAVLFLIPAPFSITR